MTLVTWCVMIEMNVKGKAGLRMEKQFVLNFFHEI